MDHPLPTATTKNSPLRWYRRGLLAFLTVFGLWILWVARPILTPFVFAFVLSYLLAPPVEFFSRFGLRRYAAILLVYTLLAMGVAAVVLYLAPLLFRESFEVVRRVPGWAMSAQNAWSYWLTVFHEAPVPAALRGLMNQTATHLQHALFGVLKGMMGTAFGLVPGVLSLLIAPILAFYVLKDLDRIRLRFWALLPIDWHPAAYKMGLDVDRVLNGFIRGQLLVALTVGILSAAWMAVLHIPFALLVGFLSAVTDIIPYVGPIVGALPAIALALTISPLQAVWVVLGFLTIHQLEGAVIGPKVMGDSVGLHPLMVIFAILAGGELAGVTGLLLAVPATAVLKVVFGHLYQRFTLVPPGDEVTRGDS